MTPYLNHLNPLQSYFSIIDKTWELHIIIKYLSSIQPTVKAFNIFLDSVVYYYLNIMWPHNQNDADFNGQT